MPAIWHRAATQGVALRVVRWLIIARRVARCHAGVMRLARRAWRIATRCAGDGVGLAQCRTRVESIDRRLPIACPGALAHDPDRRGGCARGGDSLFPRPFSGPGMRWSTLLPTSCASGLPTILQGSSISFLCWTTKRSAAPMADTRTHRVRTLAPGWSSSRAVSMVLSCRRSVPPRFPRRGISS